MALRLFSALALFGLTSLAQALPPKPDQCRHLVTAANRPPVTPLEKLEKLFQLGLTPADVANHAGFKQRNVYLWWNGAPILPPAQRSIEELLEKHAAGDLAFFEKLGASKYLELRSRDRVVEEQIYPQFKSWFPALAGELARAENIADVIAPVVRKGYLAKLPRDVAQAWTKKNHSLSSAQLQKTMEVLRSMSVEQRAEVEADYLYWKSLLSTERNPNLSLDQNLAIEGQRVLAEFNSKHVAQKRHFKPIDLMDNILKFRPGRAPQNRPGVRNDELGALFGYRSAEVSGKLAEGSNIPAYAVLPMVRILEALKTKDRRALARFLRVSERRAEEILKYDY